MKWASNRWRLKLWWSKLFLSAVFITTQSWKGCCEGQGQETSKGASTSAHAIRCFLQWYLDYTNKKRRILPFCTHQTHWRSQSRHPSCLLSSPTTVPPHHPGSPLQQTNRPCMSIMNTVYTVYVFLEMTVQCKTPQKKVIKRKCFCSVIFTKYLRHLCKALQPYQTNPLSGATHAGNLSFSLIKTLKIHHVCINETAVTKDTCKKSFSQGKKNQSLRTACFCLSGLFCILKGLQTS